MNTPTMIFVSTNASVVDMPDGTYRPAIRADGTRGAVLRCPSCHATFSLGSLHLVGLDGAVTPSVVHSQCGWHAMVVLA